MARSPASCNATAHLPTSIPPPAARYTPPGPAALVYCANAAHEQACQRAVGHRTRDPLKNEFLRGYVEDRLRRLRWTPARIAGRLRHEFGNCYERNLCAETIYEWIYSDDAPADLRTLLPRNAASAGLPVAPEADIGSHANA